MIPRTMMMWCAVAGLLVATPHAVAQRGAGAEQGIAQQAVRPEVQEISGVLEAIETASCPTTTGRAIAGVHLKIRTVDDRLMNVHLGPAEVVSSQIAGLEIGDAIQATVFRTPQLAADDVVAQSIDAADLRLDLRDAQLRPTWAPMPANGQGRGRGLGVGAGPANRRGPGAGFGRGPARGGRWNTASRETQNLPADANYTPQPNFGPRGRRGRGTQQFGGPNCPWATPASASASTTTSEVDDAQSAPSPGFGVPQGNRGMGRRRGAQRAGGW